MQGSVVGSLQNMATLAGWVPRSEAASVQVRLGAPPSRTAGVHVAAWTIAQHGCRCCQSLPAMPKALGWAGRAPQARRAVDAAGVEGMVCPRSSWSLAPTP